MEVLMYAAGAAGILFVAYKFIVSANRRTMTQGREYLSSGGNASGFLDLPVNTLKSDQQIAALMYVTLRPWRDTRAHYQPYFDQLNRSDKHGTAAEKKIVQDYVGCMGVNHLFAMLAMMVPLPQAIGDVASKEFNDWTALHKRTLESESHQTVAYFLMISSSAAAEAVRTRMERVTRR